MRRIYVTICICLMTAINMMAQSATSDGGLTLRQQSIVKIASCTGRGDLENLKPALAAGLAGGLTVNEIREVLIHAYAYCGFPRSLRALQTFIAVLDERKTQGIEDTAGRDASPVEDNRTRYERGRDILAEISGVPADAPKAGYAEFAPVIERFLKEHLFADLFERDVLTYEERELATVSVIAALGESVEPMLRSHMAICRNLGMTQGQLDRVLTIARAETSAADVFPERQQTPRHAELHGRCVARNVCHESRFDGLHRRQRDLCSGCAQQLAFASGRADPALHLRRGTLSGERQTGTGTASRRCGEDCPERGALARSRPRQRIQTHRHRSAAVETAVPYGWMR